MPRSDPKSENHQVKLILSTHLKEKQEKIFKVIEKLKEQSDKGTIILVEGKKDLIALRNMGILGSIKTVKTGGKSLTCILSEIENQKIREVILLMDFDRRGKELTKSLKKNLEHLRIKPITKFWNALGSLTGRDIQCIEGLPSYLEKLRISTNNVTV